MWKTTARYTEIQKNKATEGIVFMIYIYYALYHWFLDHKLKQVYIPNYTKPNPNLIAPQNSAGQPFPIKSATPCEDCFSFEANQWYSWGPSHMHLRLCGSCWILWKKHGGLKHPHECGIKLLLLIINVYTLDT
jgi:metastasis-associated protein MTA